MVYTLRFFFSKCSLFHNSKVFGSCIIHILYTGCAKIKRNNCGAKRLMCVFVSSVFCWFYLLIRIGVIKELAASVLRVEE